MNSITRLIEKPIILYRKSTRKKSSKKDKIFVVGFSTWKIYLRKYFSEYELVFLPKEIKENEFKNNYKKEILKLKDNCEVFIWGYKAPTYLLEFLEKNKVSTKFVEDGFIRSVQLGATKAPPMSLCLDSKTPYFDATRPSELEQLLNNFDFKQNPELLQRAKAGIKLLCESGISKYNNSTPVNIERLYGEKKAKRILVLGQVEDDASILFGCEKRLSNNDVVRLAVQENREAQVIYKPHPDVLNGHRPYQSNPREVANICTLLTKDIPLANALETIDHVYTITSLAGFEAIMRGIKVTTLGCPFYSGWGLTDDRQPNSRRTRRLKLEELFSVSYLVYPKYFEPEAGTAVEFEDTVRTINEALQSGKKRKIKNTANEKDIYTNIIFDSPEEEFVHSFIKKGLDIDSLEPSTLEKYLKNLPRTRAASICVNYGLYDKALDFYNDVIEKNPTSELYLKRAQVKLKKGDFSESTTSDFKAAVSLSVDLSHAVYSYFSYKWELEALSEKTINEFKRVLDSCSTAQKKQVRYGGLLLLYAAMLNEVGKKGGAKKYYQEAVKLNANTSAYLPLRFSMSRIGLKKAATTREQSLFKKILQNNNRFDELVKSSGGSVCVVGNAPTEQGRGLGSVIDSHKLVIRFNSYNTEHPFCDDYGKKTDVWVRMPFHPYVKNKPNEEMKLVIFSGSNRINRPYSDWDAILEYEEDGVPVSFFNQNHFYELQALLGGPPTSGLMICYSLYKITGPLKKSQCYGFSFLDTSPVSSYHYSDKTAYAGQRHHWDKEHEVFKLLIDKDDFLKHDNNEVLTNTSFEKDIHCSPKSHQLSHFDKIISSSPGISDYVISGHTVKYLHGKETTRHMNFLRNKDNGEESNILSKIYNSDKVCFIGFGRSPTGETARELAEHYNKSFRLVEYGFISSMHLPSEKQFNFSLVLDDIGIFYDTTKPSRIESILNTSEEILAEESVARATAVMDKVVHHNITKYNNSPDAVLPEKSFKHRILVIDQTANDNSILLGQCETFQFGDMLKYALDQPNTEVVLKLHPETVAGAKGGNLTEIKKHLNNDKLTLIDQQCNVMSLIKQVDEVYVMTSGVGFEALMVGKPVRCFGVPFYSGWGLTTDMVEVKNPRRNLSIEALFAAVFFHYTVFFHPEKKQECSMEQCIEWIIANKPDLPVINIGN